VWKTDWGEMCIGLQLCVGKYPMRVVGSPFVCKILRTGQWCVALIRARMWQCGQDAISRSASITKPGNSFRPAGGAFLFIASDSVLEIITFRGLSLERVTHLNVLLRGRVFIWCGIAGRPRMV
jgi:hypothetical protein